MAPIRFIQDISEPADAEALDAYSRAVTAVARTLGPSVVSIRAVHRDGRAEGAGSGVVISSDGFLLTSAHVVQGAEEGLRARLVDGRDLGLRVRIAGGTRPLPPRTAAEVGRAAGIEVVEVVAGSPAERAGLRPEDLIVAVDGEPVADVGDLQRLMGAERIGRAAELSVIRDGSRVVVPIVPVELTH